MSESETRGKIQHPDRVKQIIAFDGMHYKNKITPTDFDACIEYKDVAWFICEVKYNGAKLHYGQQTAINRFVADVWEAGKHVLAIIADHNVENPNEPVLLKDCIVRELKYDYEDWHPPINQLTVGECVKTFFDRMDEKLESRCKT